MIFVLRVTTNKEDQVVDLIMERINKKNLNILAIARPHGLKGYVFIEAENRDDIEQAAFNLPYVKGLIRKTVSYAEIENLLQPVIQKINIEKNNIVEIIAEPFKKEKARVVRIDKKKEEVVVELLEAAVPIPVTVKIDNIKVIRREKPEEKEK